MMAAGGLSVAISASNRTSTNPWPPTATGSSGCVATTAGAITVPSFGLPSRWRKPPEKPPAPTAAETSRRLPSPSMPESRRQRRFVSGSAMAQEVTGSYPMNSRALNAPARMIEWHVAECTIVSLLRQWFRMPCGVTFSHQVPSASCHQPRSPAAI